MRRLWVAAGLSFTGLGFAGVVLPLLPATPFFLVATYAFARSSPRLHGWLLDLPRVGPMLRDHGAGLGVPRRIKAIAVVMASLAATASALTAQSLAITISAVALGALGVGYVLFFVPTREAVTNVERSEGEERIHHRDTDAAHLGSRIADARASAAAADGGQPPISGGEGDVGDARVEP